MTFEERTRLIKHLDSLLKRKYKGNAQDYADRIGISRAAFFRLLDYIKNELAAPIHYCKNSGCYKYSERGIMFFGFLPMHALTKEGLKKFRVALNDLASVSIFFLQSQTLRHSM